MAHQEPMCWVSTEPSNNDHVYHTDPNCPDKNRILHKNLARIPIKEAHRKNLPKCSRCQSA